MSRIRLGQLSYINCLPVYHALEEGLLPIVAELVMQPPTVLNDMLLNGQLDASPISSIEYAKHSDQYYILPDLSITALGRVMSILLFSKVPVTELDEKKVCLTASSATGVTLLKVLFDHYYHLKVDYEVTAPDLEEMLQQADGAFLIGDNAMQACSYVKEHNLPYWVTDLGEVWQHFAGIKMIYAIWVVRRDFANKNPVATEHISKALIRSKELGLRQMPAIYRKARRRSKLAQDILEDYFNILEYNFGRDAQKALHTFYDYAYKSCLIDDRVRLAIWSGKDA